MAEADKLRLTTGLHIGLAEQHFLNGFAERGEWYDRNLAAIVCVVRWNLEEQGHLWWEKDMTELYWRALRLKRDREQESNWEVGVARQVREGFGRFEKWREAGWLDALEIDMLSIVQVLKQKPGFRFDEEVLICSVATLVARGIGNGRGKITA